jgi:hypothetical protein
LKSRAADFGDMGSGIEGEMKKQEFRTLKGFLTGSEPDEENYFSYSASLRIFGNIGDLNDITNNLGCEPTSFYCKGDRKGPDSPPFKHDMWSYTAPIDEKEPFERHIDGLWRKLKPHKAYLLLLKKSLSVDVFLGYRTNCETAGIMVPYKSLEMFNALKIPFGISIIVA